MDNSEIIKRLMVLEKHIIEIEHDNKHKIQEISALKNSLNTTNNKLNQLIRKFNDSQSKNRYWYRR
jgi:predicted RNase H-like nuclease (RuvC/YqgF family)